MLLLNSWESSRPIQPNIFPFNSDQQQQQEDHNLIQPSVSRNSMFRTPINMESQMVQLQWESSMHRRHNLQSTNIGNITPAGAPSDSSITLEPPAQRFDETSSKETSSSDIGQYKFHDI